MMFLYEKSRGTIINVDCVKDIFPGRDTRTISLGLKDGMILKLKEYKTADEVMEAISMIAKQIATSKRNIVIVPTEEEVQTSMRSRPLSSVHHATGKKQKGHGGS